MMFLRRGHDDTSSGQFDREVFDEKMKTFEALVPGSDDVSGEILVAPTTNDDDILSLDDSVLESPVPAKKPSVQIGNGALEQTLMISPVKRPKKPQKSPVSSGSRKGLTRFLRLHGENSKSERSLADFEAVWQCSDIMSVAASVAPDLDLDDLHHSFRTQASFEPSSGKRGSGAAPLRRSSKAAFLAKDDDKDDAQRKSASAGGSLDAADKERKRSKSLEPPTTSNRGKDDVSPTLGDNPVTPKTRRRKLKKNGIDPLSQSDHVKSMISPVRFLTPSDRDRKSSRVLVRSKASVDHQLPLIPSTSPSIQGKVIHVTHSPKESPKEKTKKKKSVSKIEKTKAKVDDAPSNKEVVIIMSPGPDSLGKKKRSKSLSRLNLYDHESVDKNKRDPTKRRGGKKERRASIAGDDTVEGSVKRRSSGTVSCAGDSQKHRLSRRQLMKMMDSESVISAPARAGSTSRPGSGRSPSPRPGKMTSTLPRRRDSERGTLGSSLPRQSSMRGLDRSRPEMGQEQEQAIQPVSPSILPRRGDFLRNQGNSGPSSATTLRRKLSSNTLTKIGPEDRRELLKRIDSVNSFFGKGKGEVGSAYPSLSDRNLGQESTKPNRPSQADKSDKERLRRSSRNLSVT